MNETVLTEDIGLCHTRIVDIDVIRMEGSFRLAYNASMFTKEGLGILLTFEHLINCSEESDLVFRPLSPKQETKLYLIWNRYQTFTPIAEKFLTQIKKSFTYMCIYNILVYIIHN